MRAAVAALVALAVVLLPAGACSTGSSDLAVAESGERGEGTAGRGRGEVPSDVCEELVSIGIAPDADPDAELDPTEAYEMANRLRELASQVPEDVAEALELIAEISERIADLEEMDEEDAFEAFGEMMELMFDPRIIEVGEVLVEFVIEECGLDASEAEELFGAGPSFGGDDPFGGDEPLGPEIPGEFGDRTDPSGGESAGEAGSGDDGRLGLDDIEAVEDAHAGEPWVDKVISTVLSNDRLVSLAAPAPDDGFGEPLTAEEAVAACEAVRVALEDRQPELEVEVRNGQVLVASGAAGVPCTAE